MLSSDSESDWFHDHIIHIITIKLSKILIMWADCLIKFTISCVTTEITSDVFEQPVNALQGPGAAADTQSDTQSA